MGIDVLKEAAFLVVRVHGTVLPRQMDEVIARFVAGELGEPPQRRLVIFEPSARVEAMTWEALKGIHERAVATGMRPIDRPQRVAVVVRGNEHLGHARLCRSLWRSDPATEVEVFITNDEAAARDWLPGGTPAPPDRV